MAFMVLLALINLRGVGESVKFNVVLTLVEMAALVIVIVIGFAVMAKGDADIGRIAAFSSGSDRGMFLAVTVATSIAFFAMVGFEDSVNMVEETQDPVRVFPNVMLTGLGVAVVVYVLVAVSVVAVISEGEIEPVVAEDGKVLLTVVSIGRVRSADRQDLPVPDLVAVANTALLNMLMASRLLYGLAHQDVLPRALGKVLPGRRTPYVGIAFSTVLALGLITVVTLLPTRRRHRAVRHHGAAAAGRLRGRQRRVRRAAPRPDCRGRVQRTRQRAVGRRSRVPVPGRAVGTGP